MRAQNSTLRSIAHRAGALPALGLYALLISCGPPSWQGGIHAVLGLSPRGLRVVELPPDSPAMRAGLREGDSIVAIEGKPIAKLSSKQIHDLLAGEVGSLVTLTVLRDDVEQLLSIPRAPYTAPRKR